MYIFYSAHNDGNVLDKTLLVVRFGFGLAASRGLVSQTCCRVLPRLSFLIFGHSCFKCIGSLWELKLPLCVHWKWCQHLLWSGRGKHCHHKLQKITLRCQSVNVFPKRFFLSSFYWSTPIKHLTQIVGINIDKQIKHVHSNQEKVILLTQIFTSGQKTSGLPQSLHTKRKIKICNISFLTWESAGSNPAPNSTTSHLVTNQPTSLWSDRVTNNHLVINQPTGWELLIQDRLADLRQRVLPSHQPECRHCSNLAKR